MKTIFMMVNLIFIVFRFPEGHSESFLLKKLTSTLITLSRRKILFHVDLHKLYSMDSLIRGNMIRQYSDILT